MRFYLSFLFYLVIQICFMASVPVHGDGFQINRYEPTPAGQTLFLVESPWFHKTRRFAAGITFNYAHKPLLLTYPHPVASSVWNVGGLEHQLIAHIDIAGAFWNRLLLSVSLPITLREKGTSVKEFIPVETLAVGDPRLGAMVRLWSFDQERFTVQVSAGAYVWLPFAHYAGDPFGIHVGESGVRLMPKAAISIQQMWGQHGFYFSNNTALYYRPNATFLSKNIEASSEFQLSFASGYVNPKYHFSFGPEYIGRYALISPFYQAQVLSSHEVLFGVNTTIKNQLQLGVAGGVGFSSGQDSPSGVPEGRFLFRIAYAPLRDQDQDGIEDQQDFCPLVPPLQHPDPRRLGCPEGDLDRDGIVDSQDQCPNDAKGDRPQPHRLGCPDGDFDHDGVYDSDDECPLDPAGKQQDPKRLGCPIRDQDQDGILDTEDSCPLQAGVAHVDKMKHGCPIELVKVKEQKIEIDEQIFFEKNKAVILAKSYGLLQEIGIVLKRETTIQKIEIQGHADDTGTESYNQTLSQNRAEQVRQFLIKQGMDGNRLVAKGYGTKKPFVHVPKEKKRNFIKNIDQIREKNRRVEFFILEKRK